MRDTECIGGKKRRTPTTSAPERPNEHVKSTRTVSQETFIVVCPGSFTPLFMSPDEKGKARSERTSPFHNMRLTVRVEGRGTLEKFVSFSLTKSEFQLKMNIR